MSAFGIDWATTPLGPRSTWSPALGMIYDVMMSAHVAMCAAWGPEQTFIYNAAYAPFLGARHPDALGKPIKQAWPDIWHEIEPLIERAMAGERVQFTDRHFVMTRNEQPEDTYWDFSYSALHDGGQVVGFLNVTTDATHHVLSGKRHVATAAALRSQNIDLEQQVSHRTAELQLYGEIVRSSAAPICAFDTECRLIAFNPAHSDEFFRIFGHRVQVGEVFPDLFPPDQREVMRGFMTRALSGEAYTVTEEFGDPTLAKPCWEVSYSPLHDAEGAVIGAFHYARDISERLKTEHELALALEALRQSQKMEAVGQLTGGVAHDFNNLLTIVRSSVDLLRRPDLPEVRKTRYLDAVSDTVDRAAKLTAQLLAFARRQSLKPEAFDTRVKLHSIIDMLDTVIGARVLIDVNVPDHPCFVHADLSQFETALVNMMINARDAMDGEGHLTLSIKTVRKLPPIRGHASSTSGYIAVSITDTGTGIPPEQISHVFEPFFTTKDVSKGTGLGLSQVFGFAKQSGGTVDVQSIGGEGTTFTLYLPQQAEVPYIPVQALSLPDQTVDAGKRILVVEDNLEVGRFCTQILEDLGYTTAWATNAEEALAQLGTNGGGFDAVFSDVVMPGMDGVALAEEIRRCLPSMPVVLASGYSHVLADEGRHGFEFLHKPYSAEQLARILQCAMGQSKAAC